MAIIKSILIRTGYGSSAVALAAAMTWGGMAATVGPTGAVVQPAAAATTSAPASDEQLCAFCWD